MDPIWHTDAHEIILAGKLFTVGMLDGPHFCAFWIIAFMPSPHFLHFNLQCISFSLLSYMFLSSLLMRPLPCLHALHACRSVDGYLDASIATAVDGSSYLKAWRMSGWWWSPSVCEFTCTVFLLMCHSSCSVLMSVVYHVNGSHCMLGISERKQIDIFQFAPSSAARETRLIHSSVPPSVREGLLFK